MNITITKGRLVAEPKLNTATNGNTYTNITLAHNYFTNGEKKTDFISYTFFKKNAENICKYLTKGSEVIAQGKLTTNKYDNETTGQTSYRLQAVGLKIDFIGSVNKTKEIESIDTNSDI